MADKDYFKSIAENYCSETDDPDLQLSYYPMNAELARKFNECKISASARCAYDFIALNASNIRNGISRPVDVNALCGYLGLKRRRVYVLLAELEAHELILPRSHKSRWVYDIPALNDHTENMKSVQAEKKKKFYERKIQCIKVVLRRSSEFSSRQQNGFMKLFRESTSFAEELRGISSLLGRPLTDEQQERLKEEFIKLTKKS